MTAHIHYRTVKTGIKKGVFANPFSLGKYGLSPYMACGHGCIYCDGRAEKYYVEGDFAKDIVVRENLPHILDAELFNLREKAVVSIGSGITDVYQPVEKSERLMARISELLARRGFPASVLTKSDLILRDLDQWDLVNVKSGFVLFVSLAVADDGIRQVFEPGASTVSRRLEVIRAFKAKGIPTGVLAMPLLPGITDTMDHLDRLYQLLFDAGADFVIPAGLTLRPGRQKDLFFRTLESHFPKLVESYEYIYRENRRSGSPHTGYAEALQKKLGGLIQQYRLPPVVPHRVFRNKMPIYDEVFILLSAMKELYAGQGVDIRPLSRALNRYCSWIEPEKRRFNRRRSLPADHVDQILIRSSMASTLGQVLDNHKLGQFLEQVVLERKIFNPITLSFE